MANNLQLADATANAETNAVTALLNSGFIYIYDGTQPANANTAVTSQVRLAVLTFGATAFGSAVAGVASANAITGDSNTVAGTGTWFRALKSDGTTVVFDGSVGTSGCDLNLNTTTFVSHGVCLAASLTYTHPEH